MLSELNFSFKPSGDCEIKFVHSDSIDPVYVGNILAAITSGRLNEKIIETLQKCGNKEGTDDIINVWRSVLDRVENSPVVRPTSLLQSFFNHD